MRSLGAAYLPSNFRRWASTAHAVRAVLLAKATAATFELRRLASLKDQLSGSAFCVALNSAERAPWMSSVRR